MLSEEQETIWPPCGSGLGAALGDAFSEADAEAEADGAGFALACERVLNTIIKTRTTMASGANAIAENRFAGSFIASLTSVDLELTSTSNRADLRKKTWQEHNRRKGKRRHSVKRRCEQKAKINVDMAKKRRNTRSLSEVGYVFLSLQLGFGGSPPASPRFATPAFPRWPSTL